MNWRPRFITVFGIALLLGAGAAIMAQPATPVSCPALVTQALQVVSEVCAGQGRNSACYGNYLVEAQLAANQPDDLFDAPADIAALNLLTALKTAPLNADLSEWGVSILSVQANVPGALPGQNALFMLLGGAEIESAIAPDAVFTAAEPPLSLSASVEAVLRDRPAEDSPIARSVLPGDTLLADARSGDYLRVVALDQFGWIPAAQTSAAPDAVQSLPEFTQGESFTPMQAFYLRTGIGEPLCAQAPSALVVQGPEGLHVDIQANGADISLGSTVILRTYSLEEAAQSGLNLFGGSDVGGLLELSVIDGRATVRQQDGTPVFINEGEQAYICLDKAEDLGVDGKSNDLPVTYACGGWTIPSPIPQRLRDEFSLVDDYPLIYPVDIMTPTPTAPPTVQPGAVTTLVSPPVTPVAGQPNLGVDVSMVLTPATSLGMPLFDSPVSFVPTWMLDARLTLTNTGNVAANGVAVQGLMSGGGDSVARASQGNYVEATDRWLVGVLPGGGGATLRLFGLVTVACGEVISSTIEISQQNGPTRSLSYSMTADCGIEPTATPPPSVATNTPTLIPSGTPLPIATNPPMDQPTVPSTPSNTAAPTVTPTPSDTSEPPTETPTATDTPEPPTSTPLPTETLIPPTDVPPTDVPPTDVPPTDVPPTDVPPTAEPMMTICHNSKNTMTVPESEALNHLSNHEGDYPGEC